MRETLAKRQSGNEGRLMALGWPKGKLRGPMTEAHKRAISEARKGMKLSKAHRRRLSKAQRARRRRERGDEN